MANVKGDSRAVEKLSAAYVVCVRDGRVVGGVQAIIVLEPRDNAWLKPQRGL